MNEKVQKALEARKKKREGEESSSDKVKAALEARKKRLSSNTDSIKQDLNERYQSVLNSYLDSAKDEQPTWGANVADVYEKQRVNRLAISKLKSDLEAYSSYLDKDYTSKMLESLEGIRSDYDNTYSAAESYSKYKSKSDFNSSVMNSDESTAADRKKSYSENIDRLAELDKLIEDEKKKTSGIFSWLMSDSQKDKVFGTNLAELQAERDRIATGNTQYERGHKTNDDYYDLTLAEDWQEKSSKRDHVNPTKESLDNWDVIESHGRTAKYGDDGKVYYEDVYGNVWDDDYEKNNKPIITDKLGMFLNASEEEKENAYSYTVADETSWAAALKDGRDASWDMLEEDEIGIYYYLLNSEGQESAYKYLDSMKTELNRRETAKFTEKINNASILEQFALNAASIPFNIVGGAAGFIEDTANTIQGKDINPYSMAHSLSNTAQDTRSATAEDFNQLTNNAEFLGMTLGDTYQAVMSALDSATGVALGSGTYGVLMGMGAASSEARELYEKGASKGQIAWGGVLAGAAEMIFEKLSIDQFVKLGDSKTKTQVILNLLKQGGVEATEEMATEIANTITDAVVMGSQSDWSQNIQKYMDQGLTESEATSRALMDVGKNVWKAGIGGFISGGLMGGVGSVASYANYQGKVTEHGQNILDNKTAYDNLKALAMEVSGATDTKIRKQIKKLSDRAASKTTALNVGRLSEAVGDARTSANINDISSALVEKGMSKRKAKQYAEILSEMNEEYYAGNSSSFTLGTEEQWAKITGDKNAYSVLSEVVTDINSSVNKRNQQHDLGRKGFKVLEDGTVKISNPKSLIENKFEVSSKGETTNIKTGDQIKVSGISSIKNGKMVLKLDNGETINADDVSFASDDEALLYSAVLDMGVNAGTAESIVKSFDPADGVTASQYALGVAEAYKYGRYNIPVGEMTKKGFSADLTDSQRSAAYQLGQIDAKAEVARQQEAIDKIKEKAAERLTANPNENASSKAKKGRVHFEDGVVARGKLQKRTVSLAKHLARAIGIDIVFYDARTTTKKDGKDANGYFDEDTDTIYLDLQNSHDDAKTIMFTLSHELTHFIKKWSPDKFNTFANFLMSNYAKHGVDASVLLSRKMTELGTDDADLAYEEMICEACETMLLDSNAVYKLMELRQTDLELFEKIKLHIHKILNQIRDAYKSLGLTPRSDEAKALLEMKDVLEQIYSLFEEAAVDAAQSYQAVMEIGKQRGYTPSIEMVARETLSNIVEEVGVENVPEATEQYTDVENTTRIKKQQKKTSDNTYESIGKELMYYEEGDIAPDLTLVETVNDRTGNKEVTIKHHGQKPKDYIPKKIAYCYKLFEQHPDGTLHALFAGAKNGVPIGEWRYAQGFPRTDEGVKGMNLRERYGWHLSAGLPSAPHLMSSKYFERGYPSKGAYGHPKGSKRVWVRMAYDASTDFNSIADSTGKQNDIYGLIPFGGYYAFKENNQSEWVISSGVKIDKILSEEERQQILKDAGYDEYEAWRLKYQPTSEERAARELANKERAKAKARAKKLGMDSELSESTKAMRETIKSRIIDNPELTSNIKKQAKKDSQYMDAVNRGDIETAQRLVDEAAKEAGYNFKGFHGTPRGGFTKFKTHLPGVLEGVESIFLSKDYETASSYAYGSERKVYRLFAKIERPLIVDCGAMPANRISLNGERKTDLKKLVNKYVRDAWNHITSDITEASTDQIGYVALRSGQYDGVVFKTVKDSYYSNDYTDVYEVFTSEQVKSADPITYDDDGNVIPLSQRFNKSNPDIRYQKKQDVSKKGLSYDSLISLPNLVGSTLDVSNQVKITSNGMIDDQWLCKKVYEQCEKVQTNAPLPTYYLYSDSLGKNIEITKKAIQHGYIASLGKKKPASPKEIQNARAALNLHDLLKTAIVVNISEKYKNIDSPFAYVMMGVTRMDDPVQGKGYYAVRLIVQERKNGDPVLQEANVLGRLSAINAKKIDQPNSQVASRRDVALKYGGQFVYSIADLINDVKNIFPDTFSKDVYNHFNMQRVESKALTPLRYQKKRNTSYAPTFYSHMGKVIEGVKQEKLAANSVVNMLRGKGVKAEEIRWSGIVPFLEGKKSVSKAELQEFIAGSQLTIKEEMGEGGAIITLSPSTYGSNSWNVMMGGEILDTYSWNEDSELYESDTTGGGFSTKDRVLEYFKEKYGAGGTRWSKYTLDGGSNYRELVFTLPSSSYSNNMMRYHWGDDAEGILVHARIQDFDVNGKKMLFIEEIQSDWHNEGHKIGYVDESKKLTADNTEMRHEDGWYKLYHKGNALHQEVSESFLSRRFPNGITESEIHDGLVNEYNESISRKNGKDLVPDAPFKENYHEYVLKRLLRMAAEEGYDSIGWTPSEIQSKRWSDEFAEGYRIEYDQEMPKFLRKYGRQWGAKVEKTMLDQGWSQKYEKSIAWQRQHIADWEYELSKATSESSKDFIRNQIKYHEGQIKAMQATGESVWSMDIPDSMKESVLYEGQVLYQKKKATNRTLLANALEGTVQNEIEKNKLAQYKEKIDLIELEQQKLSELRSQIKEISFSKGKRDTAKLRELQEEATRTANRINTYDRQLLNLESTTALKNVLNREKEMAVKRQKQKDAETLKAYREKATRTQMRHKVRALKQKFEGMLQRPTDRQYIPQGLAEAIIDVCTLVNTDTSMYLSNGNINKAQLRREQTKEKLQALKDEYEKLRKHGDPMYSGEFDEVVYEMLTDLREKYSDKNLSDMTLDELNYLYNDILKPIDETLADARKLIGKGDAADVYEAGFSIIEEQREIARKRKNGKRGGVAEAKDTMINLSLSPVRNIERMSGYKEDSFFVDMFNDFEIGVRTKNKFVMDSYKAFESLTKGENSKAYESAVYDKYMTLTDENGKQFSVSKMQMMQAILSQDRELANKTTEHIEKGGLVFADLDMLGKGQLRKAVSSAYSHKVPQASEVVNKFRQELANDKWAQDYMAESRKFFNGKAKDAVNDIMLTLKHRIIAKDKNYIPFEVDKDFVPHEISAANEIMQQTINSYGMLKETKEGAPQPIIMTGLNNILDRHIEQVGTLYGLAIPVRNFNKVWNVKSVVGSETTVNRIIEENWGEEGKNFVTQVIQDLQSPRDNKQSLIYRKAKSGYITATFILNGSVVSKQIGSLFSATSMIRWRDPARMIGNLLYTMANFKKIASEVDQHTASAWMRRQGMSDAEVYTLLTEGKKSKITRALNKLPSVLNPAKWITAMDSAVALSLWRYCKADVKKAHPELDGEALNKATASFYDAVIENTQSMTDVLHRPEIQKKSDPISESFGMFKTDLYQMSGQLQNAAGKLIANKSKENAKALGKTAYSIVASATWGMLMTAVFAALRYKVNPYRDDEDEDLTVESWLKRLSFMLGGDLAGYLAPIFGSEVVGTIEIIAYGEKEDIVSSLPLDMINDLYSTVVEIATTLKEGESLTFSQYKKLAVKGLQVFGIPANNIIRLVEAIQLHAKDIANGEFLSFEAGADRSAKHHIHRVIEAVNNGNTELALDLYEDAVEEIATEKAKGEEYGEDELNEAKSALKSALGEKYKDGDISKETATKILSEYIEESDEDIYWTFDKWDYAEENGSSDDYSKYGEFYTAVETGKDLKKVIKKYVDNGVETKTLSSQITSHFKPIYSEMSKSERTKIKGYLLNAFEQCGVKREDATKKLQYWEFLGESPDSSLSQYQVSDYYEYIKPAGISVDLYEQYCDKVKDIEGEGTKQRKMAVINSLPISNSQKDAIYYAEGWKQSKLYEAPWR